MQKLVFRSALGPNQISFLHSQDPSATLIVHCGNGFDARFEALSKHSFEALGCRLLRLGEDMQRREFVAHRRCDGGLAARAARAAARADAARLHPWRGNFGLRGSCHAIVR
jgi:hypothetical protein